MESKSFAGLLPDLQLKKLQEGDYASWAKFMERYLRVKKLWFVCEELDMSEAAVEKNDAAMVIIGSTLDKKMANKTMNCETAYGLWQKIKQVAEGTADDVRSKAMLRFVRLTYRKGDKLSESLDKYEDALQKLLGTGYVLDEAMKVSVLHNAVPESCRSQVIMWQIANERTATKGKVGELISFLKRVPEEKQEAESSVALINVADDKKKNKNARRGGDRKNRFRDVECYNCHEKGHFKNRCPKPVNYTSKLKAKNVGKQRANKPDEKDFVKFFKDPEEARMAQDSSESEDSDAEDRWIVDSGASKHMTRFGKKLSEYERFEQPVRIRLGNSNFKLVAVGKGDLHTTHGILKDVLHVPGMDKNLFSVMQTMEQGNKVVFTKNRVSIINGAKTVIEAGTRVPSDKLSSS